MGLLVRTLSAGKRRAVRPSHAMMTPRRPVPPSCGCGDVTSSESALAYGSVSDPTKTGLNSPRNRGDDPRAAPPKGGYCVVVADTVVGAFACSFAQSRA